MDGSTSEGGHGLRHSMRVSNTWEKNDLLSNMTRMICS